MPNIKARPFTLANIICYQCGKPIPQGTLNWSYNTHQRGMFRHQDCNANPMQRAEAPIMPMPNPNAEMERVLREALEEQNRKLAEQNARKQREETNARKQQEAAEELQRRIEAAKQAKLRIFVETISCAHCEATKAETTSESEYNECCDWKVAETIIGAANPVPARQNDITDKIIVNNWKHERVGLVKKVMLRRAYAFLYGSPGAGKTHLIESLAEDMELPFVLITCANDMLKSELVGSRSPITGDYYRTKFRDAWEHGGVVLFDECGLAPGAFLNVLNAGMSQKIMLFPDGETVRMHENCFLLFADNSNLRGNDPLFPERNDVGGAFRNRLTYVSFAYDENLERKIIIKIMGDRRGNKWAGTVQKMRLKMTAKLKDTPVFVSPRFAYKAAQWFIDGIEWSDVLDMELFEGIESDVKAMVNRELNEFEGRY